MNRTDRPEGPTPHPHPPTRPFIDAGMVPTLDQVAAVTIARVEGGPADGTRVLDIAPDGGLHVRILPDRGFDIAHAWHDGVQVAWLSKVGLTGPVSGLRDMEWLDHYGGGLVVTCGFDNVGTPAEGVGLHGSFSHLRAEDVSIDRRLVDDEVEIVATATMHDATALGRHVEIRRTITLSTGSATVSITDEAENRGYDVEPSPVLYHINLGPPVWQPGSRIEIDSMTIAARDPIGEPLALDGGWADAPEPSTTSPEFVYEHIGHSSTARVVNEATDRAVLLSWNGEQLPRLFQWTHPQRGIYALGIEPTNASVRGRASDRADATLPMLSPGEVQRSGVRITALRNRR